MAQTEKRDVIITLQGGQALNTIQDMQVHMRKLRSEFRKTADESKRSKIAAEMKKVNGELSKQYQLTRASRGGFEKLRGTIMKLGGGLAAMMGFQVLTDQIGNLIRRNAELSDSYADVQKTTGLTNDQVKELDKSFKDLDTRSSRKELLQLARDAGKLGKDTVAEVAKFVEQADKINVALGEDLGQGALVTIGKLANIFKTDMLKIGSAINQVGASSEASEPALVEFLSRLGGIATTAKLSAPDIIGYGATLDALGLKAEMSTTALNTFFIDFIKNSEEMGRVAGFAEGELSKLIGEEGTNAGFVAFLEKLRETHPEQQQFLEALEQLGIDGARGSQVFLTLANNTEMLRKQQDIANDSFEKGTSIIDEFNVKNNNFAANLNRIQKELGRMFMSSGLVSGIESLVNGLAEYIKTPVSQKLQNETRDMQSLAVRVKLAGDNQELRNKMVQQLIDKYPKYFGHLTAEKASLEDISKAMRQVNNDYRSRIKLALRQEELQRIEKEGLELTKKQEDALSILESKSALASKHGARGYEDVKAARENLNEITAKLEANERKYLEVLEEVNKIQGEVTDNEENNDPLGLNAEFDAIMSDMDRLIAQRNQKAEELSEEEKKRIAEFAKNTLALTQQLQDAKLEAIDNVEQREITAANLEYARQVDDINKTAANEEVKNELLRQLYLNHQHKKGVIAADAEKARIAEQQRLVEEANNAELLTLELRVDTAPEGSAEQMRAISELMEKRMEMELRNTTLTTEQQELIEKDYRERLKQMWEEYREEQRQKGVEQGEWEQMNLQERVQMASDYISTYGNMMMNIMNSVFDFASQNMQVEHDRFIAQQDKERAMLDEQLNNKVISQSKYNKRVAKLDEEREKRERQMKRKQFANEKASRLTQAIINTALGVTQALGSMPPPASFIMAALTGALGAAEIAMISQQANPYALGGRTKVEASDGNTYYANQVGSLADGGRYTTASYGIVGEKGTEFVIPNWLFTNPDYTNTMAELEAAVQRGQSLRSSSSNSSATPQQVTASTQTSSSSTPSSSGSTETTMVMEALKANTAIMEKIYREGVQGVFPEDKMVDGLTRFEEIAGRNILSGSNNRKPGERIV
jgi:TP901 family phage tail tape measure protein